MTMNDIEYPAATLSNIEAARLLLEKMGINPADLLRQSPPASEAPAFAEYIPRVSEAVSAGTRRVYGTYWNRVLKAWGPRSITSVTPLEISQLAEQVKASVVQRRNARGGRGAAEHLIAALRCMFRYAVADGILTEEENPAIRVPKPRRLRGTRMALPHNRLEELSQVAASTGDDPALDVLLLRLHIETACRRGGALALMPEDLDLEQCLIRLHEKGRHRALPASIAHADVSPARARPKPGRAGARRTLASLRQRPADNIPALRLPVEAARPASPLGGGPAGQHALDTAHGPDLGRA